MKAIVRSRYGGPEVLSYEEIDKPTPKKGELLIRVKATSLNMADSIILTGKPQLVRLMGNGLFKPKHKVLGGDFSGVIEAIGQEVTHFKVGDEVFGDAIIDGFGAFGEYVCVSEKYMVKKPVNVSFEAVAGLPIAAGTALRCVYDTIDIKASDRVLVNGASGCVGLYVVQLLKSKGAHVTGTSSKAKMKRVKEAGADWVIDYGKVDYWTSGEKYDVIIDTAIKIPVKHVMKALTEKGKYLLIGGNISLLMKTMIGRNFMKKAIKSRLYIIDYKTSKDDLQRLSNLIETGKIVTLVDKVYPLHKLPEAMTYFQSKKSCGKVIINSSTLSK